MSVEEIKKQLATLTDTEQREVTNFLFSLRLTQDPDYQTDIERRLADPDPAKWVTLTEFEELLDKR